MSAGGQMPLDLGHRPAMGMADFLVAESNQQAVDWLDRWPAWSASALAIHGPPGCGKTHLTRVWAARLRMSRRRARNSSSSQPTPTPKMNRPPDNTSSEAIILALTSGSRYGTMITLVPSLTVLVTAAA